MSQQESGLIREEWAKMVQQESAIMKKVRMGDNIEGRMQLVQYQRNGTDYATKIPPAFSPVKLYADRAHALPEMQPGAASHQAHLLGKNYLSNYSRRDFSEMMRGHYDHSSSTRAANLWNQSSTLTGRTKPKYEMDSTYNGIIGFDYQ